MSSIYISQIDPSFEVYVKMGSKGPNDFIVTTSKWPAANQPPTHSDWVKVIRRLVPNAPQDAITLLRALLEVAESATPVQWPLIKLPLEVQRIAERAPKIAPPYVSTEDQILPVDGYLVAISLILFQETTNYPKGFVHKCLICSLLAFAHLHAKPSLAGSQLTLVSINQIIDRLLNLQHLPTHLRKDASRTLRSECQSLRQISCGRERREG